MTCTEKSCTVNLTATNTFVLPLVAIATAAEKQVADLQPADLVRYGAAICEDCQALHQMMGDAKMFSWEASIGKISREKAASEAVKKAAQRAADQKAKARAHRAAAYRGEQSLGAILMAKGFHPSAKTARA